MNRRNFLVRSSMLAAAGLAARPLFGQPAANSTTPAAKAPPAPAPTFTEFKPLRRDVGIFTGRGGTIGWLASKEALVVVDTQFPDTAALCLAGLPNLGQRKLDVVINTHHHGDHTGGNPIFKPATKTIVAHVNVPKLQMAAAERADRVNNLQSATSEKSNTVDKQVFADTTFPDLWRHEIGNEIVSAQYHGPAHTSGDVIVHFERANVVHMGDIMFNRIYPVIDRVSGASVRNWVKILEEAAKTYPADAIYVFGHGSAPFGVTGVRGDLLILRDYFSAVLELVQQGIAAGKTKEQIVAMDNMPGFPDFHVKPSTTQPAQVNRFPGNLSVAYDELTEKKA
jgi:glyoxylase-like metal-dependent hydrolase (beta-lactamase superfamily II)